jgi:hypothetical protein
MTPGRFILGACLALSLAVALAGCAPIPKGQVAGGAIAYNLAVEKAQNEMLLLNIVRASKRYPMYFTVLNDVKASMSYTLQAGMYAPLGKAGSNPTGSGLYTIAPSASYTSNPLFDVALLNSKEFVHSMLEPVQPQTFDYYWQQGWSKEMLLYLFVHSIERRGRLYKNNPFDETFNDFRKEVVRMADSDCELTFAEVEPSPVGPEIKAELAADDLRKLIDLHKAGLTLTPVRTTDGKVDAYQLKSIAQGEYAIECGAGEGDVSSRYKVYPDNQARNPGHKKQGDKVYLRSPESILYYLGEIVRAERLADDKTIKLPTIRGGKDRRCESRLFVAREARAEDVNPFAAVDYEGVKYVIPRMNSEKVCPEDVSTYVLSLLSLLTARQSASDLPAPVGVVTTIGR